MLCKYYVTCFLCTIGIKNECLLRFYDGPIRRRKWKPPSNSRPIIVDRTRHFKQPVDLKYPVMHSNLFAQIGYNYVNDEFEYVCKLTHFVTIYFLQLLLMYLFNQPYMDDAEASLDFVGEFEIDPNLPTDKFDVV